MYDVSWKKQKFHENKMRLQVEEKSSSPFNGILVKMKTERISRKIGEEGTRCHYKKKNRNATFLNSNR
jgi:hypothetical protein